MHTYMHTQRYVCIHKALEVKAKASSTEHACFLEEAVLDTEGPSVVSPGAVTAPFQKDSNLALQTCKKPGSQAHYTEATLFPGPFKLPRLVLRFPNEINTSKSRCGLCASL